MNADYLDNSTESKARRNVLVAAGSTLLAANLRFTSNIFDFFGLKIAVEPDRIVAVGQLFCSLLIVIFIMRSLPGIIETVKLSWTSRFVKREHSELLELRYELFGADDDTGPESPEGDFSHAQAKLVRTREEMQERFNFWHNLTLRLGNVFVDFVLPTAFGLIAIFFPSSVSNVLIPLAQTVRLH